MSECYVLFIYLRLGSSGRGEPAGKYLPEGRDSLLEVLYFVVLRRVPGVPHRIRRLVDAVVVDEIVQGRERVL